MKKIIIFLLSFVIVILFFLSPLFAINKIVVTGVSHYSEEEIINLYKNLIGKNGFCAVFEESSFSNIDKIFRLEIPAQSGSLIFEKPYVKAADISYNFPNTLSIEVIERSPAFLTEYEGIYLLIDSEGYVLETFTEENKPEFPIIQGLNINFFKIGTYLEFSSDKERLLLSIQICNLLKETGMDIGYINTIDIENVDEIWMTAYPSLSIKLGDRVSLGLKISKLKVIMDSGYDGNSNGMIDFTSSRNPIFKENIKSTDDSDNDMNAGTTIGDRVSDN